MACLCVRVSMPSNTSLTIFQNYIKLCINYLKPKKREREEKVGGVAIGTAFNGRGGTNLDLRPRRSPGSARSSFW
jgi:hypothetical protein